MARQEQAPFRRRAPRRHSGFRAAWRRGHAPFRAGGPLAPGQPDTAAPALASRPPLRAPARCPGPPGLLDRGRPCRPASTCTPSAARRTGWTARSCSGPSPQAGLPARPGAGAGRGHRREHLRLHREREGGVGRRHPRARRAQARGPLPEARRDRLPRAALPRGARPRAARGRPLPRHRRLPGRRVDRLRRAGEAARRPRPGLRPLRRDAAGELARRRTPPTSRSPRAATTPAPSASSRSCAGRSARARSRTSSPRRRRSPAQGTIELYLVAQDLTAYGHDLPGRPTLHDLLRALAQVDGIRWMRLPLRLPARLPRRARRGHRATSRRS